MQQRDSRGHGVGVMATQDGVQEVVRCWRAQVVVEIPEARVPGRCRQRQRTNLTSGKREDSFHSSGCGRPLRNWSKYAVR